MSNRVPSEHSLSAVRPRVVFFGMLCRFSSPPLAALVAGGIKVTAVVLPAPDGSARPWSAPTAASRRGPTLNLHPVNSAPEATGTPTVGEIASAAGIPLLPISSFHDPTALETLRALRPDAIVTACFPMRLPRVVLDLAPLGALNLHPSLLPRDRGPDPLFWAFHRGDRETGVTVHLMTERFDAGPILRQSRIPIPLGISRDALEHELAAIGGALLMDALLARVSGDLTGHPQDERRATYAGHARPENHQIDATAWTAERAFRFARGIPGISIREQDGSVLPIVKAIDYSLGYALDDVAAATSQARVIRVADGWIRVQADHKT